MSFSVSSALPPTFLSSYYNNSSGNNKTKLFLPIQNRRLHHHVPATSAATLSIVTPPVSTSPFTFNPLNNHRLSIKNNEMMMVKKNKGRGFGIVCYASEARALLSTPNLQWISTISSVVLMLAKGTAIQKSFLVPLFALQAPPSIISWIKGEYGIWTAFVALLVRLFFFVPGELELPFMALLLVIVSPYQVLNLRGKQEGGIIGLVIAGYLAFQHFSRTGSLQKAFDRGSIVATLAIICISVISCVLLI